MDVDYCFSDSNRKKDVKELSTGKLIVDVFDSGSDMVVLNAEKDIHYSVEYKDGSLVRGIARNAQYDASRKKLSWSDEYASYECDATVNQVSENDVKASDWYTSRPGGPVYAGSVFIGYKGDAASGSFIIADGTTRIGDNAFKSCTWLTSVTIPDSVTEIGDEAFSNCRNLKTVYYHGTADDWNKIVIDDYNYGFTGATRYYYSETQPTEAGLYWHYDDYNNIVTW